MDCAFAAAPDKRAVESGEKERDERNPAATQVANFV
jgi:hypothetical protein